MRRALLRGAGVVGALTAFTVGLIGFAHTPAGRPLLGLLTGATHGGGCPLGYDRAATPRSREDARATFAAMHRGRDRALARPALGFELDHTRRGEIESRMAAHGIVCASSAKVADLVCADVPGSLLDDGASVSGKRNLWLNFGTRSQLISVVALSRAAGAVPASTAFQQVTGMVTRRAGSPRSATGQADASYLAAGALRQAAVEFAFADYYASARITNMGRDYMLTEEYRSL